MLKCDKRELNAVADKIGVVQNLVSQLTILLQECVKMNVVKVHDPQLAKYNRSLELIHQLQALSSQTMRTRNPKFTSIDNDSLG